MLATAKLVGASSPQAWSQVHTFVPRGEKQRYGVLVAAVAVRSENVGVNLPAFGTEVIQLLHESYYGQSEGEGLERLLKALVKVEKDFEGLEVELAISVGVVMMEKLGRRGVMYAAVRGQAEVMLWRRGKLVELVTEATGGGGISGYLQTGDRVVFGTVGLFAVVEKEVWERELAEEDLDEVIDRLAPAVHTQDSSLVAAVLLGLMPERRAVKEMALKRIVTKEGTGGFSEVGLSLRRVMTEGMRKVGERMGWVGRSRRELEGVYVGATPEAKRRRVMGTVAVLLLALLVVSVTFGVVRQKTSKEAAAFRETQAQVERLVAESDSLRELNSLRARVLLREAQEIIETYKEGGSLSSKAKAWGDEMEQKLKESLKALTKVYEERPEVFLDLNLVREGSRGRQMDFDGKQVVVLDEEDEVVLAMEVKGKKAGVVGGGELLNGAATVAVYFGRGFVVSDRGMVELSLKGKTAAVVIEPDEDWGEIGEMDVYGGNLYLLDKQKGEIYRYSGGDGGFGARREWLGQGVNPDFSKVVSMAIDGDIWVLTSTGKIERYTQGTGVAVEIVGLDVPANEPRAVYTDEESERVYILDAGNKRVVVINKNGEYEAQYRAEELGMATDMVVAEKEGKILFLVGSVVYEIPLR